MLLVKTKLNTVEVLTSKALLNLYTIHDEFASVNNVIWEYNERRDQKSWKCCAVYYVKTMEMYCISLRTILWTKILVSERLHKID